MSWKPHIAFVMACALLGVGCGDDASLDGGDARLRDGGGDDAGVSDGGETGGVDAGVTDGGGSDGSRPDGGADAGPPPGRACDLGPLGETGAVIYVCDCSAGADSDCVPGDDGADGSSPARALRTYEAARNAFSDMGAGDTVALCAGGSFTVGSANRWVNTRCRADRPCIVRPYDASWASGDEGRPLLTLPADGRIFAFEDPGAPDHDEGYAILDLDLRGNGQGWAVFVYNDSDDITLCGLNIDGFDIAVHVGGSNAPDGGDGDGDNARIVLSSSRITNNGGQGWLGGCDDCAVLDSQFENNGFDRPTFNHHIYFSGSGDGVANRMRAVGNELYRSAIVGGQCAGVALVVHGEHDGLQIEGNLIREDIGAAGGGCWGIAVDGGYAEAESFRNVIVRGNTLIDVGNVAIGLSSCDTCLIENNVVVHRQSFGATAIAVPDRDRGTGDLAMNGITVRNNSIYATSDGTGILVGREGGSHVVVSNAVHYGGSGRWSCLDLDLPASAYRAVDHNLCFGPGASVLEWEAGSGDLAAWQAASPFDDSSRVADPQFTRTSGAGPDLSAESDASPMVNAGHPSLSAPTDITGAVRDTPDIGAFERR